MNIKMKKLTLRYIDSGNCRAYVTDESNKSFVIIDQGHSYERALLPRFELHTHTSAGEPDCPVYLHWILEQGEDNTPFSTGLSHYHKTEGAQRVLSLMDSVEDGEERYCEFVKKVAKEMEITAEKLDLELEPFI